MEWNISEHLWCNGLSHVTSDQVLWFAFGILKKKKDGGVDVIQGWTRENHLNRERYLNGYALLNLYGKITGMASKPMWLDSNS